MKRDTKLKNVATDKKDLDKYTKFFTLKATELIVQSRLGEKISTSCKPHSSGPDWVSLIENNQNSCREGCFVIVNRPTVCRPFLRLDN